MSIAKASDVDPGGSVSGGQRFLRAELNHGPRRPLSEGRWANAVLTLFEHANVTWVVKDFRTRTWLVRNLIGRFLIRRELSGLRRLTGVPGTPQGAFRVDAFALAYRYAPGTGLPKRKYGPLTKKWKKFIDKTFNEAIEAVKEKEKIVGRLSWDAIDKLAHEQGVSTDDLIARLKRQKVYRANPTELCKKCGRRPAGPLGICSDCMKHLYDPPEHLRSYYKKNPGRDFFPKTVRDIKRVPTNKLADWYGWWLHQADSFVRDPNSIAMFRSIEKEIARRGKKLNYDRKTNNWYALTFIR